MKKNGFFSSERMDRVVMGLSLIGIILCAVLLISDGAYQRFFNRAADDSSAPVIGEISFAENDIRHRSAESLSWKKAKPDQRIRTNDSVFTGEKSQSQVKLKNGGRVDLGANSLVKFSEVDNIQVPNLALGNFRVVVTENMKIAIGGEVLDLQSAGSEIQVVVKEYQKPQVRLLSGSAKIKTKSSTKTLRRGIL